APMMPVTMYYRPFWRPVVAGTMFAMSVFVLSWYLMLGCHVGINSGGIIDLGGGAAVWLCVTACIAYFFGGAIASAMTASNASSLASGCLKGTVLWALSIPLGLIGYSFLARSGSILIDLNLPHAAAGAFPGLQTG